MVYVPVVEANKSIFPSTGSRLKPDGEELNEPPDTPLIDGLGSVSS